MVYTQLQELRLLAGPGYLMTIKTKCDHNNACTYFFTVLFAEL